VPISIREWSPLDGPRCNFRLLENFGISKTSRGVPPAALIPGQSRGLWLIATDERAILQQMG
jgi:hypothetical protein